MSSADTRISPQNISFPKPLNSFLPLLSLINPRAFQIIYFFCHFQFRRWPILIYSTICNVQKRTCVGFTWNINVTWYIQHVIHALLSPRPNWPGRDDVKASRYLAFSRYWIYPFYSHTNVHLRLPRCFDFNDKFIRSIVKILAKQLITTPHFYMHISAECNSDVYRDVG